MDVYKVNECLGTWSGMLRGVDAETVDQFARQLRQSSVLPMTRRFVAWVVIDGSERREIARGEA